MDLMLGRWRDDLCPINQQQLFSSSVYLISKMKTFRIFSMLVAFVAASQLSAQSANIKTVQMNYAAFGQGNIPAILATLTDDCTWTHPGNPAIVPFAGTFRGKADIGNKFFAMIPTAVEITVFEPRDFREEGNTVITPVYIKGKGLATGKEYDNLVEMRWTFDAAGKVTAYQAIVDPSALEMALTK